MSLPILYVFEYQAQKLCALWVFFLFFLLEMLCAHLYVPPIYECRYARYVYMNPDVEF